MARLKRGAKSQAIREELAKDSQATTKEIVAAIKAQGIKVSSQMVSTLRYKENHPTKQKRRKKKAVKSDMVSVETLVKAKKLVEQLGGVDLARELIETLAKLQ